MASDVDICNSALNMIGASNIVSLTEDSRAARVLNQRYEFVRDAVFSISSLELFNPSNKFGRRFRHSRI